METKSENRIDWIALAIVCFLNVHFYYILGSNMGMKTYAGSIAFIFALVCFCFAVMMGRLKRAKGKFPIILFLNIIIFPIISIELSRNAVMTWSRLLTFSVLPMCLMSFEFKPKKLIDYTCYFAPLTLLIQNDLFKVQGSVKQMEMGYSYAVIHLCVACIIELIYFRKENKRNIYMHFCTIIGVYLTVRLLLLSTRGTFLSIIIALMLFYITSFDGNARIKKHSSKTIVVFVVIVVFMALFDSILKALSGIVQSFGDIAPAALRKMLDAYKSNDITHGRDSIVDFTLKCIADKPLLGYGTQMFGNINGHYSYPHNCVLQFLFENGILGSVYILLNLFIKIYHTVFPSNNLNKDEILARQLIMLTSLPMLFLSNEMWTTPAFWMFLMYPYNLKMLNISGKSMLSHRKK